VENSRKENKSDLSLSDQQNQGLYNDSNDYKLNDEVNDDDQPDVSTTEAT
jgi:hypothetical protein